MADAMKYSSQSSHDIPLLDVKKKCILLYLVGSLPCLPLKGLFQVVSGNLSCSVYCYTYTYLLLGLTTYYPYHIPSHSITSQKRNKKKKKKEEEEEEEEELAGISGVSSLTKPELTSLLPCEVSGPTVLQTAR